MGCLSPRLRAGGSSLTSFGVRRDTSIHARPRLYHNLRELQSERVWLRSLTQAGIRVPVPVQAVDGRDYVPVPVSETGEIRYASLAHWIEGEIVADVVERSREPRLLESYYARLGSIMGSMHNQASGWVPPASFARHSLDADGLMGNAPYWGPFWKNEFLSRDERDLLLRTRDVMYQRLAACDRGPDTYSMIHADLHHNNLVVANNDVSVIDFDDCGLGWHQYDIAVAFFHCPAGVHSRAVESAFLRSYRCIRPIPDEALRLVPMFKLIRGMAILGWMHQRPEVQLPDGMFEHIKAYVIRGCETFAASL